MTLVKAQPTAWWWVGWAVSLATTTASLATSALFVGAFLKPHSFGGRDGQGAAGLAALLLLVGAGVALISAVLLVVATRRVRRRRQAPWLWPVSLGVPALVTALALALGLAG
ncbi:MAG: hypothetical protein JNJ54_15850 [Myxococcaceae bacterium]|nr:hypothetical protein [Myxococcaceae bacterium]